MLNPLILSKCHIFVPLTFNLAAVYPIPNKILWTCSMTAVKSWLHLTFTSIFAQHKHLFKCLLLDWLCLRSDPFVEAHVKSPAVRARPPGGEWVTEGGGAGSAQPPTRPAADARQLTPRRARILTPLSL